MIPRRSFITRLCSIKLALLISVAVYSSRVTYGGDPLILRGQVIETTWNKPTGAYKFEVTIVDEKFSIWSAQAEDGPSFKSGYDGVDSYTLENRQINPLLKRQFGEIHPGGFPEGDRMVNQVLWTAFCSTDFLNEKANSVVPFYFFRNNNVKKSELTTSVKFMDSQLRLPRELKVESQEFGVAYKVESTTRVSGIPIPSRAMARVLLFNNTDIHTSGKLFASYEIMLSSAERILPQNEEGGSKRLRPGLIPSLGTNAVFITDWRFKKEGHEKLEYSVGDSAWPSRESRVIQELLRRPMLPSPSFVNPL